MIRKCEVCNKRILKERLEVLPNTRHCPNCSRERALTEREIELDSSAKDDMIASVQQGEQRD